MEENRDENTEQKPEQKPELKRKRGDLPFDGNPLIWIAVALSTLIIGFMLRGSMPAPAPTRQATFTPAATFTPLATYTPFPTPTISPSPTAVTSTVLVSGVQSLGQLVSLSVQLASVDIEVGVRAGVGNLCGYSARHAAQGTISAGIDLAAVSDESITYDPALKQYTVRLPQASLLNCQIDYIDQYVYSATTCAADWDGVRMVGTYLAVNNFRESALEAGILTRAEQQARLIIQNFAENFTGAEVAVEFDEESQSILPVSCQPNVPSGWSFDAATGAWIRTG